MPDLTNLHGFNNLHIKHFESVLRSNKYYSERKHYMATVSYNVIATGTIDPKVDGPNGSKTIISGLPNVDAVHTF